MPRKRFDKEDEDFKFQTLIIIPLYERRGYYNVEEYPYPKALSLLSSFIPSLRIFHPIHLSIPSSLSMCKRLSADAKMPVKPSHETSNKPADSNSRR